MGFGDGERSTLEKNQRESRLSMIMASSMGEIMEAESRERDGIRRRRELHWKAENRLESTIQFLNFDFF